MTTYSTDAMVKERLGITSANHDTQVGTKRDQAYAWINNRLSPYESTLPIAAPTQAIMEIEADIAAGFFREERATPTAGEPAKSIYRTRGEKALEEYIITNYTPAKRVPPTSMFEAVESTNTWE